LISDHADGATAKDISAQLANLPEIVPTMLRHPDLFARQVDIGIHLLSQGTLSGRDRELAILRIGWLCQAPYEWGEHVLVAKKLGIAAEAIERITVGSEAPGWSEHEQAILRATEELHGNAMISDATWATLSKRLDDKQLIELPIVIGQYQAVAYYQNSLRLRLHDGNLGLKAR
jgi:alkylhydroperoxidase family enzyme